jgi:tetratricopeptide (TPR) repeat protein
MRRETLVFTAAGVVFGLVVGYMAASWDVAPRPPAALAVAAPAAVAAPSASAVPGASPEEVKALETLAARQPGDPAVRVELGNLHMDAERWDEASRWYREALALDPARSDVATDLGACLVSAGRPAEGLAEFEKVLREAPDHRNALYNKGVALLQMGRPSEAAAAWEELLRHNPGDAQIQGLRGRIAEIRATSASGK